MEHTKVKNPEQEKPMAKIALGRSLSEMYR